MEWNESGDALLGNILSGEYSAYFGLKNLITRTVTVT